MSIMHETKLIALLLTITSLSGITLASTKASADTEVIDQVRLTIPIACTMSGTGTTHSASLSPGTYSGASGSEYENGIGKTTLTAICNDDNGFSIYAIGYTGNQYEGENHTKLIGQSTNSTISTKAYASGDTTSNWSMKLTKITDSTISYNPQNLTIATDYDNWHAVPDTFAKVAEYHANTGSSTTDTTLGVKLETTYAAYISSSQPADTYIGQVKYTMVHPYTEEAPLYPQTATSGCINYFPNGSNVEGTMGCQEITDSATVATLFAPNFSRQGYGFAGWSDVFDYATNPNAHFYGPNEDIIFTAGQYTGSNPGLSLYAVWVKSAGNLQDSSKVAELCGTNSTSGTLPAVIYNNEGDSDESTWSITANLSNIAALTDTRDNQTYAIAKLTDDRCWMIENLRLADTHQEGADTVLTTLTTTNTNNPLNDNDPTNPTVTLKHNYTDANTFTNLSATNSQYYNPNTAPDGWCDSGSAACLDQSRLMTDNTTNRVTYARGQTMSADANLYAYGNYYNWYSATAGNGTYGRINGDTVGDICPSGWHLPTGTGSGEYGLLSNSLGGYKNASNVAQSMNTSTNPTAAIMAKRFRHFPNNLVNSGFAMVSPMTRGSWGNYWTSTAQSGGGAYIFDNGDNFVYAGTFNASKYLGWTVRCVVSDGV